MHPSEDELFKFSSESLNHNLNEMSRDGIFRQWLRYIYLAKKICFSKDMHLQKDDVTKTVFTQP